MLHITRGARMVAGSVHRSVCGSSAARPCRPLGRPFAAASPRGHASRSATNAVATDAAPATAVSEDAAVAAVKAPSFKAALDFKFVKDNLQLVTDNCRERLSGADPARVVALYDEYAALKVESESLRASRNENSSAMKVRGRARDGALLRG